MGPRTAERAEDHGALDAALEAGRPRPVAAALDQSRTLIAITFLVALVAGAVIALVSGVWWMIFVALALHAVGTIVVVATTLSLTSQVESPDPRTAAALEEQGVTNPDAALNEAVRVAADTTEDEEAARARGQQEAITPSRESRPTEAASPASRDHGEGRP